MEKRKKIGVLLVTLITILVITVVYFGYKFYLLQNLKLVESKEIKEVYTNIGATFKIETKTLEDQTKKDTFNNITFTTPTQFILNDKEPKLEGIYKYDTYYLNYKDDKTFDAFFRVGSGIPIYEGLIKGEYTTFGFTFVNINFESLFKIYNITNDYELQKYIVQNYNKEVNLFSSINEIKMNYIVKALANVTTIIGDMYQIDGDLKGFIYNVKDKIYEVHLFNNNEQYTLLFTNKDNEEYFNLEKVQEILTTISYQ